MSRIQVDRQIYPTYAKIPHMRSGIKRFGTILPEILSELREDLIYANSTYARFTVYVQFKHWDAQNATIFFSYRQKG